MNKHILFIQGGGDGGYEADTELVSSLRKLLGKEYEIEYPELKSDESASDFGWPQQIDREISKDQNDIILVGHSLGASMILKYISETPINRTIEGVFLLATPFWEGDEEWKTDLKLREGFADKLPDEIPFFFYHCQDDEEVPFSHLDHYKQNLSRATFREMNGCGHQLSNALTVVANDIKSL